MNQTIPVIGAGIASLTFARCLLQNGIRTTLYEKASRTPRHNYGITLHAASYRPLLQCLGIDELAFKASVAVDAEAGCTGRMDNHVRSQHKQESFRANRARLETWLSEGLDIRFSTTLESIETNSGTGRLQLHFSENRSQIADFVVAADGVHSLVRGTMFPRTQVDVLPLVAFNGKRRVSPQTFEAVFAPAMKHQNVLQEQRGDTLLNISLNDIQEEHVSISWTYSRPPRGADDALHRPDRSNADAHNIPEQLFEEVAALTGLTQHFAEVFDETRLRQDRILHWLMRKVLVPLPELQHLLTKERVLLMGDAAHAEPIIGGNGANAAILDGVEFARGYAREGLDGIAKACDTRYGSWEQAHGVSETKHQDII